MRVPGFALVVAASAACLACGVGAPAPRERVEAEATLEPADLSAYPWFEDTTDEWPSLASVFPPPEGAVLDPVEPDSFAAWLAGLPVDPDRTAPRTFRGRPTLSPAAGIVVLDVGEKDLQQCADSVLRLHAEYQWSRGGEARDAIAYHFTSGHEATWSDWKRGKEWRVAGNEVARAAGPARGDGRDQFALYLEQVFMYAGTRSLPLDTRELRAGEPVAAGDVLVNPGSPGHAVLVLRTARSPNGRRLALLGEGWMPAQEFHVVNDAGSGEVWLSLPTQARALQIPGVATFQADSVRRFETSEGAGS